MFLMSGCTFVHQEFGSDRFLHAEFKPVIGKTTVESVLTDLGPPDELELVGGNLWFHYRFKKHTEQSITLSYYLPIFKGTISSNETRDLVLTFDHEKILRQVAGSYTKALD